MAQGADRADGDEHRYIGGRKPGVVVQERDQRRHEQRAHQCREKKQNHRIFARELARQDLESRVEHRGGERQQRRRRQHFASGPNNQQHADEAGDHERPTWNGNALMQERRRHQGDDHRRRVVERGRLGKRKELERRKEAQRRADQHDAPHYVHLPPPGAHQRPAHGGTEDGGHHQRLHAPACPDQERHRIALAQIFDADVERGEARHGGDDHQDRRKRYVRRSWHQRDGSAARVCETPEIGYRIGNRKGNWVENCIFRVSYAG